MTAAPILVTRPRASAGTWVRGLRAAGLQAHALPLIEIVAEPMNDTLRSARERLVRWRAVMFVSGNAVRFFFRGMRWLPQLAGVRAWSPGPGTTQALIDAGWPTAAIDGPSAAAAQYDSEHLWAQVAPQVAHGTPVLIVRGGDAAGDVAGRNWLAEQVVQAGGQLDQLVCYRRLAPQLSAQERAQAQAAASDGSIWVFSSGQAIAHLLAVLPGQDWSGAAALVTHPRIGRSAQAAGFGRIHRSHPVLADVARTLEALP